MTPPIRILIADDHLIIRQGIRLILETEDDFELVGEAADGAEALRLCAELHPDVVLMDLRMPGMDGLAAIERLHIERPEIAVVILTTFNEDDLMLRGLRRGLATCSKTWPRGAVQCHPGRGGKRCWPRYSARLLDGSKRRSPASP
jgi:NarL family two-component system response regulator YdfI